MRRVVVLPLPEGPSIEKNSPSLTSRSMLFTATTSPNRFSIVFEPDRRLGGNDQSLTLYLPRDGSPPYGDGLAANVGAG